MRLLLVCTVVLVNLSCANVLTTFGDRTSDDAILVDIDNYRIEGDYTSALAKFSELTAATQALQTTRFLQANIYAESCGLDFFTMSATLAEVSGSRLFQATMEAMPDSTTTGIDHCVEAETLMYTMESEFTLTEADYAFITYLALAKMGAILNVYADTDSDGTRDAGFDACSLTSLPETPARHLATSISLLQVGLVGLSAQGNTSGADATTIITSACAALAGVDPNYDFCGETDVNNITTDNEKGIRSLVKEDSAVGIGHDSCTGDLSTCNCPSIDP